MQSKLDMFKYGCLDKGIDLKSWEAILKEQSESEIRNIYIGMKEYLLNKFNENNHIDEKNYITALTFLLGYLHIEYEVKTYPKTQFEKEKQIISVMAGARNFLGKRKDGFLTIIKAEELIRIIFNDKRFNDDSFIIEFKKLLK